MKKLTDCFKLENGVKIPCIGFGTWQAEDGARSLPKLMSVESMMPSSHLILCCPLLLLPPIPPSISRE